MGRKKGSFIVPRLKITQDEQFSEKIQEIESENLQEKIQILFPGNLCSPNPQRQHRKKNTTSSIDLFQMDAEVEDREYSGTGSSGIP